MADLTTSAIRTSEAGLDSSAAIELLKKYGPNELVSKKKSPFRAFVRWLLSPIPLMLIVAIVLSYVTGDKADAYLIFILFIVNYGIQRWHEHKADSAVKKLEQHLALSSLVKRDGQWKKIPARELVPGDRISLRVGAIVPADAKLLTATNISVNESMLTGESLPKEKKTDDEVYSASFMSTGSGEAVVTHTGNDTYFGAAVKTLDVAKKRSTLEADIVKISKLLAIFALVAIVILTIVFSAKHNSFADIATLDISLLIAGIPVALPTVMSLIVTAGVLNLAKGGAVVRRLSSLEDLANVNLLLSDKTGTLTENKIRVAAVVPFDGWNTDTALVLAASTTDPAETNPLEGAIRIAAKDKKLSLLEQQSLIPGDSQRKRSTAVVSKDNAPWTLSLGAPGTVASLCRFTGDSSNVFTKEVQDAANRGDRTLLLAVGKNSKEEKNLEPVALLFLADTLRPDAAETIKTMQGEGVSVKMLTGDGLAIAKEVAQKLNIEGELYERSVFDDPKKLREVLPTAGGFAEVLPKDKYSAVETAKSFARVGVTGDGANDIPSVSDADVGIAVASSVDALRDTADMVLLTDGLTVIGTAILEARKVFMRLYHYSLFRMAESTWLIISILIIGVIFGKFPLTPIQVLLLAFLNDVPIITIAVDHVKIPQAPAFINSKRRAILSFLFAFGGILNSLSTFFITYNLMHLPWAWIQTLFFLQLVVAGHMLIYVAHTEQRWFRFLPGWQVITAVSATQILATIAALLGFFVTAIPFWLVAFVWVWSFFWMQIMALLKDLQPSKFGKVETVHAPATKTA